MGIAMSVYRKPSPPPRAVPTAVAVPLPSPRVLAHDDEAGMIEAVVVRVHGKPEPDSPSPCARAAVALATLLLLVTVYFIEHHRTARHRPPHPQGPSAASRGDAPSTVER